MKSYVVKHKDLEIRLASRSGGIFTAISDLILDKDGVVYGCRINDVFQAEHDRAETRSARDKFRGSKYVQSDKSKIFKKVKEDLKNGKMVLFSGTSCEVNGLISFLGGGMRNLVTMDIVCHGVPSPLLWSKYLKYVEEKYNSKVHDVQFRNKQKFGWSSHYESIKFDTGMEYDSRDYASIFYSHLGLRPSCYHCPFKNTSHPADITIADCWGIEKKRPDFNDNKGVSLVLINTEKGFELFHSISKDIDFFECDIHDYMQLPLRKPCSVSLNRRGRFWKEVNSKPFSYIVKKYGNESLEEKLKKLVRALVPKSFVGLLKRMLGR